MLSLFIIFGLIPSIVIVLVVVENYLPPLYRPLIIFTVIAIGFSMDYTTNLTFIRWCLIIFFLLIITLFRKIKPEPKEQIVANGLYNYAFNDIFPITFKLHYYGLLMIIPFNILIINKVISTQLAIIVITLGFTFFLWCRFILRPHIISQVKGWVETKVYPIAHPTKNVEKRFSFKIDLTGYELTNKAKNWITALVMSEDGYAGYQSLRDSVT